MNIQELQKTIGLEMHTFKPTKNPYVLYFLTRNNEIVYIGKSSDNRYMGRIRRHKTDKKFDRYHVMPVNMTEKECLAFEASLISTVRPEYNAKDAGLDLSTVYRGIKVFYKSLSRNVEIREIPVFERRLMIGMVFIRYFCLAASGGIALFCYLSLDMFKPSYLTMYSSVWWLMVSFSAYLLYVFIMLRVPISFLWQKIEYISVEER